MSDCRGFFSIRNSGKKTLAIQVLSCMAFALAATAAIGFPDLAFATGNTPDRVNVSKDDARKETAIELKAGVVQAKVSPVAKNKIFPLGAFAFTEIDIKNSSSKKPLAAEIILETNGAKIKSVTGKGIRFNAKGDQKIARISKLKLGKTQKILVELILGDVANKNDDRIENTLKITLRHNAENGSAFTDNTELVWPIESCAKKYHDQIVGIREENAELLLQAVKNSRTRDRRLPGRWMFLRKRSSAKRRKCVRVRKYYSYTKGRYIRECVRYTRVRSVKTPPTDTKLSKEHQKAEREIYRFAGRFVSSRGMDPELRTTRDSGWVTRRVSIDLRAYLGQKHNPAICSGAIRMVDYFEKRLTDFRKRSDKISDLNSKAVELADIRLEQLYETLAASEGGHPGFGQLPLSLHKGELPDGESLISKLSKIAELYEYVSKLEKPEFSNRIFKALSEMKSYLKKKPPQPVPANFLKAQNNALSIVEAAAYVALVNRHYEDFRKGIFGSIASIRTAHSKICSCSN